MRVCLLAHLRADHTRPLPLPVQRLSGLIRSPHRVR